MMSPRTACVPIQWLALNRARRSPLHFTRFRSRPVTWPKVPTGSVATSWVEWAPYHNHDIVNRLQLVTDEVADVGFKRAPWPPHRYRGQNLGSARSTRRPGRKVRPALARGGGRGGHRRAQVLPGGHRAHLDHATHVLDRFHMCRWFAAGLVLVRRGLKRRRRADTCGPPSSPSCFRAGSALLHGADTQ